LQIAFVNFRSETPEMWYGQARRGTLQISFSFVISMTREIRHWCSQCIVFDHVLDVAKLHVSEFYLKWQ
jgi:hypothetical protein